MARRKRLPILRPVRISRCAAVIATAGCTIAVLGLSTTLSGVVLLWLPATLAAICGLLWNAVRNQGAWLSARSIVLEAVVGCASIPLDEIAEVHLDEAMTTVGVKTSTHYVVQSIVTVLNLKPRAGALEATKHALGDRSIPCVVHGSLAEVYKVSPPTSPFMWRGAVLGTLTRPLVWGSALAGLLYGLLIMSTPVT